MYIIVTMRVTFDPFNIIVFTMPGFMISFDRRCNNFNTWKTKLCYIICPLLFSAHPIWALRRPLEKVNLVPRSLPLKPPCHWNLLQNLNKKKTMKIFQIGTCKVNTFTSINVGSSLFIGPSVLYHQERKFCFVISRRCKDLFEFTAWFVIPNHFPQVIVRPTMHWCH